MTKNQAYLELGGNEGNRFGLIQQAKTLIKKLNNKIVQESSIYETPPWGFKAEQNFYNQIIKIETSASAINLIQNLHDIEKKLGRVRNQTQYSSRTMDLDILFYNAEIIKINDLIIPHERLHLRNFVLIPLSEIAPDFIHPIFNKTVNTLLDECPDKSMCKKVVR